jgi:hypothetical protein
MTPAEYLPDLAADLDRLVPLETTVVANWADVVRRAEGVRLAARRRSRVRPGFLRVSRLRIMVAAVVVSLLLAGIVTAGYLAIRALVGGGSAPAANGPVTIARTVGDIAEISAVGPDGRLQRVWRCPTNRFCGFPAGLDWSPDGKRLAFTLDSIASNPSLSRGVHVVDVSSGRDHHFARRACFAEGVDWAPDGTRLAFVCNNSLAVIGVDGGELRRIVAGSIYRPLAVESPSWAPDGKRIVFAFRRGGRSSLYLVNADGSRRRLLVKSGAFPAWSPDGTKIAYLGLAYDATCGRLHLVTPAGVDVTPGGRSSACGGAGRGIGLHGSRATWSPDGTQMALGTGTGTYVMNADGTRLRRISTTSPEGLAWQNAGGTRARPAQHVLGCPDC